MQHPSLELAAIVSAPFAENSHIAHLPGRKDCVVLDPGFEPDKIEAYLDKKGLQPAAFLLTHGHVDHIAGNEALKSRWPDCPLVVGRDDENKLSDPWDNLSAPFGDPLVSPPADQLVDHGQTVSFAGLDLEVRAVPGHSRGHVVFVWHAGNPIVVFGGDVLFAGGVGRTDFPDGDFDTLAERIHSQLFTLPDDTLVLPGHGPATTIGREKRTNPFVGAPAGYRAPRG